MEDNTFKEGQDVHALFWQNDSSIMVGEDGVERITVSMEYGQMAGVPWFIVWRNGKMESKHNAAYVESVSL